MSKIQYVAEGDVLVVRLKKEFRQNDKRHWEVVADILRRKDRERERMRERRRER